MHGFIAKRATEAKELNSLRTRALNLGRGRGRTSCFSVAEGEVVASGPRPVE